MDKLIQKRRGVLGLLLLIALILPVMGCQQQEVYLEDLLPRDSVQQAAVSYLNIGVGENIPAWTTPRAPAVRPAAQPSLRRGAGRCGNPFQLFSGDQRLARDLFDHVRRNDVPVLRRLPEPAQRAHQPQGGRGERPRPASTAPVSHVWGRISDDR